MKILELFAGTRSIGKAFEKADHDVFSVDWDEHHQNIDWYVDISTITSKDILGRFGHPEIIWASPDCNSYSVAAISHHRMKEASGNLAPKTEYARFCDKANVHLLNMIDELQPKYFFIENPRGGLRKMEFMQHLKRYTVTYCQYGENRQKPTDIWTNHPNPQFKEPCKRGMPCHESAPRGSKTGTQGQRGRIEKAMIPTELCEHIVKISQL